MAKFFSDRPIFAWVIALFIIVMGGVAITQLPIAQYPPVAPPSIVVNVGYPGASAQTLENSVIAVRLASTALMSLPGRMGQGIGTAVPGTAAARPQWTSFQYSRFSRYANTPKKAKNSST